MSYDYLIKKSVTSKIIQVMLRDSTTGAGKTGVAYTAVTASYTREGSTRQAITLSAGTAGDAFSSGKWAEIDATNCKGMYQLHVPDAAITTGVNSVDISLQASGMIDKSIKVLLLDVDMQDSAAMGMTRIAGTLAAGTHNPQTGDSFARLGAPAGASVSADVAAVKTDSGLLANATYGLSALKTILDGLPTAVWAATTRTLSSYGSLISDTVTAVWAAATRTITGGTVTTLTNAPTDMALNSTVAKDATVSKPGTVQTIAAVTLATSQPNYAPAKAGDAMALTGDFSATMKTSLNNATPSVTVSDKTGFSLTTTPPTAAAIADAVWDEATSGHQTAGSTGLALTSASAPTAAQNADAVWDELLSGHSGAGSAGLALATASSGGVDPSVLADAIWDESLSGHVTAGTAGKKVADLVVLSAADVNAQCDTALIDVGLTSTVTGRIDAAISTRSAPGTAQVITPPADMALNSTVAKDSTVLKTANYTAPDNASITAIKAKTDTLPTDPADQSAVESAISAAVSPLATSSVLATVAGYVDTEIVAIKAVTDKLDTALVLDGSVYKYTTNALENAPAGGGGTGGATVEEIDAQLSNTHGSGLWGAGATGLRTITVSLVTESGAVPIADASVYLLNSDSSAYLANKRSDANGLVIFNADTGSYNLRIIKSGINFDAEYPITVGSIDLAVSITGTPVTSGITDIDVQTVHYDQRTQDGITPDAASVIVAELLDINQTSGETVFTGIKAHSAWIPARNRFEITLVKGKVYKIRGQSTQIPSLHINKTITVTDAAEATLASYLQGE
jgi:hypothetical protein